MEGEKSERDWFGGEEVEEAATAAEEAEAATTAIVVVAGECGKEASRGPLALRCADLARGPAHRGLPDAASSTCDAATSIVV